MALTIVSDRVFFHCRERVQGYRVRPDLLPAPPAPRAALPERPRSLSGELREIQRRLSDGFEAVHLRVEGIAGGSLPGPFAGSHLRGALGALLSTRPGKLWPALFGSDTPPVGGRGSPPRPLMLVPPAAIDGGPFAFELKLFAPGDGDVPALLEAVLGLEARGLGQRRGGFTLRRVESLSPGLEPEEVYSRDGGLRPERARRVRLADFIAARPPAPPSCALSLLFRTPLRLQAAGRLCSAVSPELLLRASVRRLAGLGGLLGQSWPREWPGLDEAAREIVPVLDETRWLDWGRYSARQGKHMRLGGLVGRLEYRNVPGLVVPLLRAASFFHLGKAAAFGLGAIELEAL